jgi:hypothetical protein
MDGLACYTPDIIKQAGLPQEGAGPQQVVL